MPQWEFLIVEVAVDPDAPRSDAFHVDVDAGYTPLTVRGVSDEMRNALSGHATYEVVFVRGPGA